LRVANVKDGLLDLDEIKSMDVTANELDRCQLMYGDLLLTEGGDADKLGRGTFWQEELPLCVHQNHVFRVRFDLQRHDPAFLAAQIGSAYGKSYFLKHAKQTTGIATINQKVLANFPLRVPSLDEQRSLMLQLKAETAAVERLEQEARAQLSAVRYLKRALLQRAFGDR
jgi:type I restriction enzyme S subunit